MKYTRSEKMEIIRMVEDSSLSVRKTLQQLDIPRSSFYEWYKRYQEYGYEGLAPQHRTPSQFWNAIPDCSQTTAHASSRLSSKTISASMI